MMKMVRFLFRFARGSIFFNKLFVFQGKKYEIPAFCINDPIKIELKPNSSSALPENFKKEKIKVLDLDFH